MAAQDKPLDPGTSLQNTRAGRRTSVSSQIAEAGTAWISLLTRLALIGVGLIAIFSPGDVPLLKRFGLRSSEINILGSKLTIIDTALSSPAIKMTEDGKLLIAGLDASQVPDRIARLEQTVKDQAGENASLRANVQDLQNLVARTKSQLDNPEAKTHGTADNPVSPPSLSADLARLTTATSFTLKAADENATRTADILKTLDVGRSAGFGVVFGGDKSPDAGMDEIRKARNAGINDVALYLRQGSWRSVARFGSQAAATAALPVLRQQRADAYVVDLAKWCPLASPDAQAGDGGVPREECGF